MEALAYVLTGSVVLALAVYFIRRTMARDKAAEASMTPEELRRKRALQQMGADV